MNATRATPGFVPVTLTEALTMTGPIATLPEVGAVKQTVTLYAPDEGVLVLQVFVGMGVAVGVAVGVGVLAGVAVGVGVLAGVAVAVGVGFGVLFPCA